MSVFEDAAPELSKLITLGDVVAEVYSEQKPTSPAPKPITSAKAKELVSAFSVYGKSTAPAGKEKWLRRSLEDFAFMIGLDIDQVKRLHFEWKMVCELCPEAKEATAEEGKGIEP